MLNVEKTMNNLFATVIDPLETDVIFAIAQCFDTSEKDIIIEYQANYSESNLEILYTAHEDLEGSPIFYIFIDKVTGKIKTVELEWPQLTKTTLENVVGVEEAAKILKLAPGTIKNQCAAGRIPAKKIGKTWLIDKNSLKSNQ